ncbi:MAG: hypothetical protein JXX28_01150 [Deltaproteobacteria bacterium]|nr:hypothetical protein [Deltaproteobacteria bacterium]
MKHLHTSLILALALTACRKEQEVYVDLDGDGHLSDVDCDDTDATVFPDAPERCDGLDNDCDAEIDEDPTDADTFYADADGDGYGDAASALTACEAPQGYVSGDTDCDDRSAAFHPGAPETDCADPADYNCDGSVGYADADGDGYAACEECDDARAERFPGNPEVCDDLDNDCDSLVDNEATDAPTWYADLDGDGHGDPDNAQVSCEAPAGWLTTADDCDDLESAAFPGHAERCDGVDNDCDGRVDLDAIDAPTWYADADRDHYGDDANATQACEAPQGYVADGGDCDDAHASAHPGGTEICDSLDNDCDGDTDGDAVDRLTWHADADGDGFGDPATAERTCSQPEGAVLDGTDCDDARAAAHPGHQEVCDGLDNDCDGDTDLNAVDAQTWYADADQDGYGLFTAATRACAQPALTAAQVGDCDDTAPAVHPFADEICNGVDDDCNGRVDEDPVDASTWYRDLDHDGYAGALVTQEACALPAGGDWYPSPTDCDDVDRAVSPAGAERCNGYDDDCDGLIDEDGAVGATLRYADADADGFGDPDATLHTCALRPGVVDDDSDCDDRSAAVRPGRLDIPGNGLDDDCDGADPAAEVYVVDRSTGVLTALDGQTGEVAWTLGGLGAMIGVTAAEDGRIWVSQPAAGTVSRLAPDHASAVPVLTGLNQPYGLWWDSATQTLLVTEHGAARVIAYDPSTGLSVEVVAGLLDAYHAVRLPGDERVFATQRGTYGDGSFGLAVYTPSSDTTAQLVLPAPSSSIAPMGPDTLYVSSVATGEVYRVTPSTGAVAVASPSDLSRPYGLCGDPLTGDLFIPEEGTHSLVRHQLPGALEVRLSVSLDNPHQCATNALIDADEDGYSSALLGGEDCDDLDAGAYPGATPGCDDTDRDCDGLIDADADGDGFSAASCGGSDPDDGDPAVHPAYPWAPVGASCQAILDGGLALGDGVYAIDPDGDGVGFNAYCDFTDAGEGWTLLLAADESSTYWGNAAPTWSEDAHGASPAFLDGLDHHSPAYGALPNAETRLCFSDDAHCYTFSHGQDIPLQRFFTDGISWVEYSYDSYGWSDAGTASAMSDYLAALGGFSFTAYSCQWLGINDVQSYSSIGLLSDGNGGCASLSGTYRYHDDGALGVGLQSCVDANGCSRGGTGHLAGQTRGVPSVAGDPSIGPWYVFGR